MLKGLKGLKGVKNAKGTKRTKETKGTKESKRTKGLVCVYRKVKQDNFNFSWTPRLSVYFSYKMNFYTIELNDYFRNL